MRMPHLQINDTLPPIGLAQDHIPLDALALACHVFTPWLSPPALLRCLFWCLWHLSHDKHNETTELARQEKVVETGACCKVKRVFAKNKRGVGEGGGGNHRSRAVLHQGAACQLARVPFVLAQKSPSREKRKKTTVKLSFMGRNTTLCCYK